MNELTPKGRALPAPGSASAVQFFEKHFLALDAQRRRLKPVFDRGMQIAPLDPAKAERLAPIARRVLKNVPPADDLFEFRERLAEAISDFGDRRAHEFVCAVMLDSIPNARQANPAGFADSLILWTSEAEKPIGPEVAAAAVFQIVRGKKWQPSVSEYLDACLNAREAFRIAGSEVPHIVDLRHSAEDVLTIMGEFTPPRTIWDDMDDSA